MPKASKDKVKPDKKALAPKAQTVEELKKHEPIIQDRVLGLTVTELAKKHGIGRQHVRTILDDNAERISKERDAWLEERQEKINKALDEDVQELAYLVTASTRLMRKMIDRINERLDEIEQDKPLKDRDLASLADVAVKAVDRVHTVVLNQQKEAGKE